MLRYFTAGESHGKTMLAVIDGFPAGLAVDTDIIDTELRRRQGGYGRGGRQRIETDTVEILTGVWRGATLGSPIALQVVNQDYKIERMEDLERPRPGHADLAGAVKYLTTIRPILERSSARETTARVAAGGLARQLLSLFGIEVIGYVTEIGGVAAAAAANLGFSATPDIAELRRRRDESVIYGLNPKQDDVLKERIDAAQKAGDTLGGVIETRVFGLPFGLGSHAQWDRKLDGRLAQAVMSIQAIKGVEIGLGFECARRPGSQVHDPIQYDGAAKSKNTLGYIRPTNNAGGLEAGMTNGQPLVIRAAKKPISTLARPLESINLATKEKQEASYERSDICAVSAASVIMENVIAFELAAAMIEKFGGDSVQEMRARHKLFQELAAER